MNGNSGHYLASDRTCLGQRFLTCACGHTESGSAGDKTAQDNMDHHFRQASRDLAARKG